MLGFRINELQQRNAHEAVLVISTNYPQILHQPSIHLIIQSSKTFQTQITLLSIISWSHSNILLSLLPSTKVSTILNFTQNPISCLEKFVYVPQYNKQTSSRNSTVSTPIHPEKKGKIWSSEPECMSDCISFHCSVYLYHPGDIKA
jgi:hypothetical protein